VKPKGSSANQSRSAGSNVLGEVGKGPFSKLIYRPHKQTFYPREPRGGGDVDGSIETLLTYASRLEEDLDGLCEHLQPT
jgi:hypothetical protein